MKKKKFVTVIYKYKDNTSPNIIAHMTQYLIAHNIAYNEINYILVCARIKSHSCIFIRDKHFLFLKN